MHTKKLLLATVALALATVAWFKLSQRHSEQPGGRRTDSAPVAVGSEQSKTTTNTPARGLNLSKVRRRAGDLTADERLKFSADFEAKLKPAVERWCRAYGDRIPFSPDEVSPEKFVERFSNDTSYAEYVFVINGVTLGVCMVNGVAEVDYLNNPQHTKLLGTIPKRSGPMATEIPIDRNEVIRLLEIESGSRYLPHEIRMTPSGFSGGLDGGAFVHVGGDPAIGASWNHDFVFGPDGKLAFYLRGRNRPVNPNG